MEFMHIFFALAQNQHSHTRTVISDWLALAHNHCSLFFQPKYFTLMNIFEVYYKRFIEDICVF